MISPAREPSASRPIGILQCRLHLYLAVARMNSVSSFSIENILCERRVKV